MNIIKCSNCGKEKEKHAKGMCTTCYKKLIWKPKIIVCKRCGREMPHHSKGLCGGCYNFVFHLDKAKDYNNRKRHNVEIESYKKITACCIICGFDKIVELHHVDENSKNNSSTNLIGLCPNHHKMFHDFRYKKEIMDSLQQNGIEVPQNMKLEFESEKGIL